MASSREVKSDSDGLSSSRPKPNGYDLVSLRGTNKRNLPDENEGARVVGNKRIGASVAMRRVTRRLSERRGAEHRIYSADRRNLSRAERPCLASPGGRRCPVIAARTSGISQM